MTRQSDKKIQLLSQTVIEKIAAGEVIERPASVVKELLENAIDAQADHIEIIIEDAGFSLIKIIDNGIGMGPEDISLCLKRHATSKIATADDLFAIATMGFRGEALASIAAVTHMTISSSNSMDGLGHSVSCSGGESAEIEPVQHNRGTTIVCRDLFFNVPARKKFMKSRNAERMAISRMLEHCVAAFPAVHFTYTSEGKRHFDLPAVDTPAQRIAQVAGNEFARKLIHCSGETNDMAVSLYISPPPEARARPRYQNLYVNLRRVDNDSVTFAAREAFSRFITSHMKASWFCFLDVDPSRVDVNIHPTKQRIKFDDEKSLFSFIFHTVHDGIAKSMSTLEDFQRNKTGEEGNGNRAVSVEPRRESISDSLGNKHYSGEKAVHLSEKGTMNSEENESSALRQSTGESEQTTLSFLSVVDALEINEKDIENRGGKNVELTDSAWNLIPCYQIHKKFILAPIKNGIVIIDQHAAHERILYEEALDDITRGRSESQRLLFPVVFDLSKTEKEVVLGSRDYFNMLGFDVQDFGGQSIAVSAMPATGFMKSSNIEEAVREMITSLIEEKDKELLAEPQKRFAASFACGAAIKFGQELKQEEMNILLNSLFATKNPYICPHGRPTLFRMSMEELSRRFLR